MSVSFDKKDGNVVVVIGTGPGGGVLASELAQKGVKVVALEAGGRHGPEDFVNDEWASFGQISWLDSRSTSGSWRVAKDFSGCLHGSLKVLVAQASIGRVHHCGFKSMNGKPRLSTAM